MAKVSVDFQANTAHFNRGVNGIHKSINGVRNSVNMVNAAIGALAIGKLATATGGFLKGIAVDSSKAAMSVETLGIQFEVLIGSAEKAKRLTNDIKNYGASTPLEQKDLQQSAKLLLAFGIEVENVMSTLKMLGDVSMGDGQKLQSLARAFGQASAAGRLTMEDVNQMIDAGFNPLLGISDRLGISMSDLRKKVSDGEVPVSMLTQSFQDATSEGGKFHKMLERVAETTEGKLSNFNDGITDLQATFGKGLNSGLGDLLDKGNNLLPQFKEDIEAIGQTVGGLISSITAHIPDTLEQIKQSIKDSGGIMGAVKSGLINILKDDEVKKAASELFAGVFGDFNPLKAGGYGAGAAVGTIGVYQLFKGIIFGLGEKLTSKTKTPKPTPSPFGAFTIDPKKPGELGDIKKSVSGMSLAGRSLPYAAMAASAIAGGWLGDKIGYLGMERLSDPFTQPLRYTREELQGMEDEQIKRDSIQYAQDVIDSVRAEMILKRRYAEEQAKLNQGIREEIAAARKTLFEGKSPSPKTPALFRYFDALKPSDRGGMEFNSAVLQSKNQPLNNPFNLQITAFRPFLSSLARIGGASAFTNQSMPNLQKITNDHLKRIERNTKNIKASATWS